jgi:CheY-like chemotaxis protein
MVEHVTVLLVEDDDVDAERVERAFRKMGIVHPIRRARDGIEALEILRGESGEPLSRPYIVLLDLKMPRMGGLQFLGCLREDPAIADTVVFVLTTSRNESDRCRAYLRNVAGYIVKSRTSGDFVDVASMLESYWRVVDLP